MGARPFTRRLLVPPTGRSVVAVYVVCVLVTVMVLKDVSLDGTCVGGEEKPTWWQV